MGISIWQLLIILVIVLVLFGAKRLRNVGSDLGTAVRGFRNAVKDGEAEATQDQDADGQATGSEGGEPLVGGHLGSGEGRDEDFAGRDTARPSAGTRERD